MNKGKHNYELIDLSHFNRPKQLTTLKMSKQISFLLAVFLINVLTVSGQDWQTVRSGRIAFFKDDQGRVKCIRIDSVKFDRDSVLYPMANIQRIGPNCFLPQGNSWIGKKVIVQNNGVNLFFNNEKDTIRIHTLAKVGESWTLFEIKDSIKVTAEVESAEIQSILGESDSVMTISFKVYEKNVLTENHYLSDESLIISKNNGFVQMMNFSIFPKEPNSMTSEILESFSLIGLTNPDKGVQNLTWLGVHDFQVGDEFHIIKNTWNWSDVPGYSYTYKTRMKYLERKESKDTLFYKVEKEESILRRMGTWDSTSYTYTHDTITESYIPDVLFDKLPEEPILSNNDAFANMMTIEGSFIKKYYSYPMFTRLSNDSCWYYLLFDGGGPGYYLKGLGGYYYGWSEIISGGDNNLVYYKKGSTIWGTPLVITDVKSLKEEDQIKVYPNPASDFVILENTSGRTQNYHLHVLDLQGREVFRNSIELTNSYRLDISSLKEGAYLLKLLNGEKQITRMVIRKD